MEMHTNKFGRIYKKGKPISEEQRLLILRLHSQGLPYDKIAIKTGVSKSTCHKIVQAFIVRGTVEPKVRQSVPPVKLTEDVLQVIEYEKIKKPSVYCREIQNNLLKRNVCTRQNVPSVSYIQKAVHNHLGMSFKRLQKVPKETLRPGHQPLVDAFFAQLLQYRPEQIHFFDEASVIRTSGNRNYGHSVVGERAVEVQKYASNATFTINLCCGFFNIDYFDVIEGPSNARELLAFFDQVLQESNMFGNPMLAPGDCVVMDNCGFHHHRHGELLLRRMLQRHGVTLIFLPSYSPEYNVAEFIFRLMRFGLQKNTHYTQEFTELAIVDAILAIPSRFFPSLFRKCGYV